MMTRLTALLMAVLLAALIPPVAAFSAEPAPAGSAFTTDQDAAIRAIVREELRKHPEWVAEAIGTLQSRQQSAEADRAKDAIRASRTALHRDERDGVAGDPRGDVTLVEFFDYRCPYCKQMSDVVDDMIRADPKLRVVYKEFPVLGPGSVLAAKATIAARRQGKYLEMHRALMASRGTIDDGAITRLAKPIGIDVDRLNADMKDPGIETQINDALALGHVLGLTGTPAFVIGDEVVLGASEKSKLAALVDTARKQGVR